MTRPDDSTLAEAFDTTYNVLILLYPKAALTAATVVMPPSSNSTVLTASLPSQQ